MKTLPRLVPLVIATLLLVSCGGSPEEAELRLRAQAFGDLLIEIPELSEASATSQLADFIEPSPQRDAQVEKYHADFAANSEKYRVTRQKIVGVSVNAAGDRGEVGYETVVRMGNGQERAVLQKTTWLLVDGVWYRSLEESKKYS